MKRLAILISGRGSNMVAIAQAIDRGDIDAQIVAVISNRPDAAGLQTAKERGIKTQVVPDGPDLDAVLIEALDVVNPDWIILAGFMRILGARLLAEFPNRILNIHPSLLPKYKGLNTHARVIEAGDSEHGCSVHYVDETLDGGEIIEQERVSVGADDTAESIAAKVLEREHVLYPRVIARLCNS